METNGLKSNAGPEEGGGEEDRRRQLSAKPPICHSDKTLDQIESTRQPSLTKNDKKLTFDPQLKSQSTFLQVELDQSTRTDTNTDTIPTHTVTQTPAPSWFLQLARRHLSFKTGMGRMFNLSPSPSSQFQLTKNLTSGQTIMGLADQLRNTLLPKSLSSGDLFGRNRQASAQSKSNPNNNLKAALFSTNPLKTVATNKIRSISAAAVNDHKMVAGNTSIQTTNTTANHSVRTLVSKSYTDFCLSTNLRSRPNDCLFFCALCLDQLPAGKVHPLICCGCVYCLDCLSRYVEISVQEHFDLLKLSCPSADCPARPRNLLSEHEIRALCPARLFPLYERLRKQQEVAADPQLIWCPRPDCEGVCRLPERWTIGCDGQVKLRTLPVETDQQKQQLHHSSTSSLKVANRTDEYHNQSFEFSSDGSNNAADTSNGFLERIPVRCELCRFTFCAHCRRAYHQQLPCQSRSEDESLALLLKRNSIGQRLQIKKCPQCAIFIQRDEGCAQMMCCKCKHVFCWFCMQSLEVSSSRIWLFFSKNIFNWVFLFRQTGRPSAASLRSRTVQEQTWPFSSVRLVASNSSDRNLCRFRSFASSHQSAFFVDRPLRLLCRALLWFQNIWIHPTHGQLHCFLFRRSLFGMKKSFSAGCLLPPPRTNNKYAFNHVQCTCTEQKFQIVVLTILIIITTIIKCPQLKY